MSPSERAVLSLFGLATRSGNLLSGTGRVREGIRDGSVVWVVLAADAAPAQRGKLLALLDARGVPYHIGFRREQLGAAIGRAPVSAVGLTDRGFARRLGELVAALPSLQE